jgi:hypothetical protein
MARDICRLCNKKVEEGRTSHLIQHGISKEERKSGYAVRDYFIEGVEA